MENCEFFKEALPPRSIEKAIRVLEQNKMFVRLGSFVIFLGDKEDHLLLPPLYCSCTDFKMNVILRKKRGYCYHIYAYCLAERRGKVALITDKASSPITDVPVPILIRMIAKEILYEGRTYHVRKMLENL